MMTAMENRMARPAEHFDPKPAARLQNPCLVNPVPLILACLAAAEMKKDESNKPMANAGRKCAELAGASPRPGTRCGGTGPVQTPSAAVVADFEGMPGQYAAEPKADVQQASVQQTAAAPKNAYSFAPPADDPGTAALDDVPAPEDWPEGDGIEAVLKECAEAAAELRKSRYGVPTHGGRHARM